MGNASKTQFLPISLSTTPSVFDIHFENIEIEPLSSINILGLNVNSNLSWRPHIMEMAKSASKKLGVLFRCRSYFSSEQLLRLYKGLIRPCMEYCSHIWGGSPSASLLDKVESKAVRLINDLNLTSSHDHVSLRRKVASLSLFYGYYFGHCSVELSGCVPPPLRRHVTPARPPIPTDILWKSPIHGSIVAVTASFPLLLSSETLFLRLSFLFLMIFHLLRGWSIITLGGHRGLSCFYFILFYFMFLFMKFLD